MSALSRDRPDDDSRKERFFNAWPLSAHMKRLLSAHLNEIVTLLSAKTKLGEMSKMRRANVAVASEENLEGDEKCGSEFRLIRVAVSRQK